MPDTLEHEDDHGQRKWVPAEGPISIHFNSLSGKLDALDRRVKELQYKQAQQAPALNANVQQVLRQADDDMKPLRKIVARIVSERECDCGWPKKEGDEDRCYCKECDLR